MNTLNQFNAGEEAQETFFDIEHFEDDVWTYKPILPTLLSGLITVRDKIMETPTISLQVLCVKNILNTFDITMTNPCIYSDIRKLGRALLNYHVIDEDIELLKIFILLITLQYTTSEFSLRVSLVPNTYDVVLTFEDDFDPHIFIYKSNVDPIPVYSCLYNFRGCVEMLNRHDPLVDLLKLCGDVEENPGPVQSALNLEYKVKQLEQEIKMFKDQMKRMSNREWRKEDREKTQKKQRRRAEGLFSFMNNTGEAVNVLANGLGPVLDSVKTAMDSIAETGTKVKGALGIADKIDVTGTLLSVVMFLKSILDKDLTMCTLIAMQIARQCGVSFSNFISMVPQFGFNGSKVEFKDDELKTSSRVGEGLLEDIFSKCSENVPLIAIGSTLVGIISLFCVGKCPSVTEMTKHFAVIGRASQGIRAVKDFITWIWNYCMEIYCKYMYDMSKAEYEMMKEFPTLQSLYGAIKLIETIEKQMIDGSKDVCTQIVSVMSQLTDLGMKAAKSREQHHLKIIDRMILRLKPKYDMAMKSPALSRAIRDEPFCVYLYGQPGVGKSVMTQVMIADYFKEHLKDKGCHYSSAVHDRKSDNEHWDGYTNQPILVIDDFANIKDSMQKPDKSMEEIQYMVNTAAYPLLMAELSLKAASYFDSELILLSSNMRFPKIEHMNEPGSVLRRMHIWAEIECDPAYGVPTGKDEHGRQYYKFDITKAAQTLKIPVNEVDPLMTEQYRIRLYDVIVDKQAGSVAYLPHKNVLTYDEFYDEFEKIRKTKHENAKKLSEAIQKRAGLDIDKNSITEKEVMDKFRDIFRVNRLVDSMCEEIKERIDKKTAKASTNDKEDKFEDAEDKPSTSEDNDVKLVDITPKNDKKEGEEGEEVDDDLIDLVESSHEVREKRTKLREMFDKACKMFENSMKSIFAKLSLVMKGGTSKLIGLASTMLHFLGSVISGVASGILIPYVQNSPTKVAISALVGLLIGYLGSKFFLDVPRACKFSLTLDESETPCNTCDVCKIMEYPSEGDRLSHFLHRIGVTQVRAAIMRTQIWTDEYITTVMNAASAKLRRAERVYENAPLMPRARPYAQGIFGSCSLGDAVLRNVNKKLDYVSAMDIIGSCCMFNCDMCLKNKIPGYDAMDTNDAIRYAAALMKEFLDRKQLEMVLRTPLEQGAVRKAEGDLVRVEQSTRVLDQNSVWVQALTSDGKASKCNGTFVVGRTMITTAHSVVSTSYGPKFTDIMIQNPNAEEPTIIPYKDCKISRIKQLDNNTVDLAMITFPRVIPNRPKIINKFVSASDIDKLPEGKLAFSGYIPKNKRLMITERKTNDFTVSTKSTSYLEHKDGDCPNGNECTCELRIGSHVEYDIDTAPGMCGSLLSVDNSCIPSKLIGMHVAGQKGMKALGVLMTQEFLNHALAQHIEEFKLPKSYVIDGRLPYSDS